MPAAEGASLYREAGRAGQIGCSCSFLNKTLCAADQTRQPRIVKPEVYHAGDVIYKYTCTAFKAQGILD